MKRKVLAGMLISAMVLGMTACGSKGGSDESVKKEDVSNAEGEQVTLEFINGSAEEQYVAWLDEVIANFEEENPDIKIEIQKTSIDSLTRQL